MLKGKSLKLKALSLQCSINYTYQTLNPYYYRVGLLESSD